MNARTLVRSLAGVLLALLVASPALAITYGVDDGNGHPNVGALVGTYSGGQYAYCSGTLIAPIVFLTAAHCGENGEAVIVTFDPVFADGLNTTYTGTFYADPLYTQRQNISHDLAVVVLDTAVSGITPAQLPTLNQLTTLGKNQQFTAVGYGGQEITNAPGGKVFTYLDTREVATSTFNALNPGYLRLSQNPATGNGGACYGDSGGPNFLGVGAGATNIIAGTTITGDRYCRSTNVTYRLDTPAARAFLGQFVTLP